VIYNFDDFNSVNYNVGDDVMQQEIIHMTVWLDDQAQIASFHSVEGYKQMDFSYYDFFRNFLQSLMEHGYRFM
jgi:hypothetical protein